MRTQPPLNRVHPPNSFVYAARRQEPRDAGAVLVAEIRPRKNGKVLCSRCGNPRQLYDRKPKGS